MTTNNNNTEEVSRTGAGMVDAIMEEALQYCGQRMAIGDSFGVPPINHIIRLAGTVREQEAEVRRLRAVLVAAKDVVWEYMAQPFDNDDVCCRECGRVSKNAARAEHDDNCVIGKLEAAIEAAQQGLEGE